MFGWGSVNFHKNLGGAIAKIAKGNQPVGYSIPYRSHAQYMEEE